MRRILLGLALGCALGPAVDGAEPAMKLNEVAMETASHATFVLPQTYGRLVSVVESAEIHYLYFEDGAGTIRVVLVGPRGVTSRARNPLQLLSSDAALIKRGPAEGP